MTYATLKAGLNRRPVVVVEVDADSCSNTYGSSPCTAAKGTTGSQKCYNTYGTCQDTANFSSSTKTYRFMTQVDTPVVGINLFPCIEDVDITPVKITTRGVSERGTVRIVMKDFPHHDRGCDPYVLEDTSTSGRSAVPVTQRGTFFGRFLARNRYLVDRVMRVKIGFIDPDSGFDTAFSTDFKTLTYFIEKVEGPDKNGRVVITAKDILKLADNKKALAPAPTVGTLKSTITDSSVGIVFENVPSNVHYVPTNGYIRIEDEIIVYTGSSYNTPAQELTLSGDARGALGTTAAAHSAGVVGQQVLYYNSDSVQDIVADLLENYADIDNSYLPTTDWDADLFLTQTYTGVITEPTGVYELVAELAESAGFHLWWSAEDAEVQMKAVAPPLPTVETPIVTDADILEDSFRFVVDEKERLTHVYMFYGLVDVFRDYTDDNNYTSLNISTDSDLTDANAYGSERVRKVYSRWIENSADATEIADRILARFANPPRVLRFRLDISRDDVTLGAQIFVQTRFIQDEDGNDLLSRYIVTEVEEVNFGTQFEVTAFEFAQQINSLLGLYGPDSLNAYTSESDANKLVYAFYTNDSGEMSNGDDGYRYA